jgi:hypothetical protein
VTQPAPIIITKFGTVALARQVASAWDEEDELAALDFTANPDPSETCTITTPAPEADADVEHDRSVDVEDPSAIATAEYVEPAITCDLNLDVTRLVLGNADCFLLRNALFMKRARAWVGSFDEETAYAVLTAAPRLLHKPPDKHRAIIKALYGLAATSDDGIVGGDGPSPSSAYANLHRILLEAPKTVKMSPGQLQERLDSLREVVGWAAPDVKAAAVRCPRLLTESLDKVAFLSEAVRQTMQSLMADRGEALQASVDLVSYSGVRVLTMPLSLVARMRFSFGLLVDADKWLDRLPALLDCPCDRFVSELETLTQTRGTGPQYAEYLSRLCITVVQAVELQEPRAVLTPQQDADSAERDLCGLLNLAAQTPATRAAAIVALCVS